MKLRQIRACRLQTCTYTLEGKRWRIIGAAEMRQPQPAHTIRTPRVQNGIGCLIVREVSLGTEDTLFEYLRIGATYKALAVVIGFQNEQICLADTLQHFGRDLAAISDDTNATSTRPQ